MIMGYQKQMLDSNLKMQSFRWEKLSHPKHFSVDTPLVQKEESRCSEITAIIVASRKMLIDG